MIYPKFLKDKDTKKSLGDSADQPNNSWIIKNIKIFKILRAGNCWGIFNQLKIPIKIETIMRQFISGGSKKNNSDNKKQSPLVFVDKFKIFAEE